MDCNAPYATAMPSCMLPGFDPSKSIPLHVRILFFKSCLLFILELEAEC